MKKNLPEVFHNDINKKLNNNEDVFYSVKDNEIIKNDENKKEMSIKKSIKQKINEIFSSSNYVYKANVKITTNNNTFNKRIIGRNNKYLITMDNEKIDINNIIDIKMEK